MNVCLPDILYLYFNLMSFFLILNLKLLKVVQQSLQQLLATLWWSSGLKDPLPEAFKGSVTNIIAAILSFMDDTEVVLCLMHRCIFGGVSSLVGHLDK